MFRKYALLLFKIAFSTGSLVLIFYTIDVSRFLTRLMSIPPIFIVSAWLYYGACQWISAYRWQVILGAKGINIPVSKLFSFYMVGMFLNNFMPGTLGGDIAKTYDLYRYTGQGEQSIASVLLERLTGLVGLTLVAVLACLLAVGRLRSPLTVVAVFGVAALLLFIIAVLWLPQLARLNFRLIRAIPSRSLNLRVEQLYQAVHSYAE